jgi:ribosomal protein S6
VTVRRYEGLFILKTSVLNPGKDGKEDGLKDAIDRIVAELQAAGAQIETVQKMDKKPFARVANRKFTSGYYVNIIFQGKPESIASLRNRFALNDDVFRVMFTLAPKPGEAPSPVAQTA